MKKYLLFLAAFAAASCAESNIDQTPNGDNAELQKLTINAATSPMTKIDITEDGDKWITNWKADDKIGGWATDSAVADQSEYTIVDGTANGKEATFTGDVPAGATAMRFIAPYNANLTKVDDAVEINLEYQRVYGSGFNHMTTTSYMISQEITDLSSAEHSTLEMSHLTAAIEMRMKFESADIDPTKYKISGVVLGGEELQLPSVGKINLTDGTLAVTKSGKMGVSVDKAASVDGVYTIHFNSLPIENVTGKTLDVEVHLTETDNVNMFHKATGTITAGGDFAKGTKNTMSLTISDPVQLNAGFLMDECDLDAPKPLIKWPDYGEDWVYTVSSQTYNVKDEVETLLPGCNWSQLFGIKEFKGTEFEVPLKHLSCDLTTSADKIPLFKLTLKAINIYTKENVNTGGYPTVEDGTEQLVFSPAVQGTFVDKRGDEVIEYDWVRLGQQVWMAESLQTKLTVDGEPIPCYTDKSYALNGAPNWADESLGLGYDVAPLSFFAEGTPVLADAAYDFFQLDTPEANRDWFLEHAGGYVYNINAAMGDKVVPKGWHAITNEDFDYLGTYTKQSFTDNNRNTITSTSGLRLLDDVTLGGTNEYGLSFTNAVVRLGADDKFRTGDWQLFGNYWYINKAAIADYIANPTIGNTNGSINTLVKEDRIQAYSAKKSNPTYFCRARWHLGNFYPIRCVMSDEE